VIKNIENESLKQKGKVSFPIINPIILGRFLNESEAGDLLNQEYKNTWTNHTVTIPRQKFMITSPIRNL